ncbi:ribosomal protein s12/S23 domain-containing protein [Ditylenchus destructor]|uniref:Small ribosomal subunit protein uS12m n=1 Tax=Ditylenchus destructor TaxID=166010 RepID=A0AAD4NG78_9BILA|nr:ribosomal protein s12/S23 domain-containing protein [Ditylenchus destructor]
MFAFSPKLASLSALRSLIVPSVSQISSIHTSACAQDGLLARMYRRGGPPSHECTKAKPISGFHYFSGIVLKTMIMHPRKPNSGNRRCALVRLWNGKVVTAFIPGIGHNLQEHSRVWVEGGRKKDLGIVRAKVMRGILDCAPVKKEEQKHK